MARNYVTGLRPAEESPRGQTRKRRALLGRRGRGFLLLALIVGGIAAYGWWRSRPPPVHYVTAPVTRGSVVQSIATTGTVNPRVTVQVGSYVSGIIQSISCDYNTSVKAGQLCAKIDPRPYQLKVDQAAASLASAKAQLTKDRAMLDYAQAIYDRDKALLTKSLVSQDTVDSEKSKRDQAQAQIGLDQATIKERQAALNAAQVDLGYTGIVSPVDGVVISRNVDVGQTVAASFQTPTLFLIGKDLTKMLVDTNVSESDVGQAHVGQKASFTVEAYPDKVFWGRVTEVRQAPITVQNVVTYDVVISVDNPNFELLPGMTANARIVTAEHDGVLRVPLQAIRFTPGGFAPGGRGAETAGRSSGGAGRPHAGAGAEGSGGEGSSRAGHFAAEGDEGIPQSGEGAGPSGTGETGAREATVFVLRDGRPQAVTVATGLKDNSYVEITGGGLEQGDDVIVNQTGGAATAQAGSRRSPLRF